MITDAINAFNERDFNLSARLWLKIRLDRSLSRDQLFKACEATRASKKYRSFSLDLFAEGIATYPYDVNFHLSRAKYFMNDENWDNAISAFNEIPDKIKNEYCYHFHALALFRAERKEDAVELLSNANKILDSSLLKSDLFELNQQNEIIDNLNSGYSEVGIKVLHLVHPGKFTLDFVDFVANNMDISDHIFLILGKNENTLWPVQQNIHFLPKLFIDKGSLHSVIKTMSSRAEKIILHSLFEQSVVDALVGCPKLLSKCMWFLWGSDLYGISDLMKKDKDEYVKRKSFISKLGAIVCHNDKHVRFARKNFNFSGEFLRSFKYTSNLCFDRKKIPATEFSFLKEEYRYILVGNSASKMNRHDELFKIIGQIQEQKIQLICPLNYGDKKHASDTARRGAELFGENFFPLLEPMEYSQYCALLMRMDAALFCHSHDQGMGTIRQLLALGKPVYVNEDHGAIELMSRLGITVHTLSALSFPLPKDSKNIERMNKFYSEEALLKDLSTVFAWNPACVS